ncbi:hypothetical protein SmJEL517_g05120 [Synchytrium microbalum]|uniref:Cilia- and flagella-associated protein 251 n=1 Tax=Synchytrium microbalum TaxID=1806994 RepID=A0A507BWX6_9FUNG|nr:uncharacterized protein SmJEL517_g05120 [Synchytrium microbalum]TPX31601.1 hypothetical protein SmJEL517_g05120 [Synchytrium microbalum]
MATKSEEGQTLPPNTLTLQWTFGLTSNPSCSIHQLPQTDKTKPRRLFYATSHTALVKSLGDDKQTLLQGHCHAVTATAISPSGRFMATADHGPASLLAIWDTQADENADSVIPIQTIFDSHGGCGVSAVGFDAQEGRYVATLGHDEEQTICIWDWTTSEQPIATFSVIGPRQSVLRFNPTDKNEIATTGSGSCSFFKWSPTTGITQSLPALESSTQESLDFYIPGYAINPPTALSGTIHGQIVLWKAGTTDDSPRSIGKFVKIHKGCITGIETLPDGLIITSGSEGSILVHDDKLRVIWTLDKLGCGPIDCISLIPTSTTLSEVILATSAGYVHSLDFGSVKTPLPSKQPPQPKSTSMQSLLNNRAPQPPQLTELLKGIARQATVVACWPATTNFFVGHGGANGGAQVWDASSKKTLCSRTFGCKPKSKDDSPDKEEVSTAAFSADGAYLAVGFANGTVKFLQPSNLLDAPSPSTFSASKTRIERMSFAPDGSYFALVDMSFAVALFKKLDGGNGWELLGRCRAHTKPIVGLVFVPGSSSPRLLSVGSDRFLAEYDVAQSTVSSGLRLSQLFRIEQTARPTAVTVLPDLHDPAGLPRLLVATDAHKLRVLDIEGHAWRRTVLGPPIPGRVVWLELLPPVQGTTARYLIFRSDEKYIGIIKVPLDGNPYRSATVLAHPSRLASCAVSGDGTRVLTCGLDDDAVHLWKIDYAALELRAVSGGTGVYPFLELVDTTPDAREDFVKEAEDFFYYCQILEQGEDTAEKRQVSDRLALRQVPNFMRALGYYPSEQDCEDLIREIQFGDLEYGGQVKDGVTLPDLIRLFVNYRAVAEVDESQLHSALKTSTSVLDADLADEDADDAVITRNALVSLLQKHGEVVTRQELDDAIDSLAISDPELNKATKWTRDQFIEKILGMERAI